MGYWKKKFKLSDKRDKMAKMRVGTSFHRIERWKNDKEYREKRNKECRRWWERNREYAIKRKREWNRGLNEFADKHCKECDKLLDYRSTSGYCRKHRRGVNKAKQKYIV